MVKKNDASTIKDEAKLRDIMGETMDIAVEQTNLNLINIIANSSADLRFFA